MGAKNSHGYAYTSVKHRAVRANRFFWEKAHGPIPQGLYVLHKCDNRACVNVDHLFLGTQKDNIQDMIRKGRHQGRGSFKLSAENVAEIRAAFEAGQRPTEIAKHYEVSANQIRNICRRKQWKHI